MTVRLSVHQVEAFRDRGYLTVPRLFGPREAETMQTWAEEVSKFPEIPGKYMMYFEQSSNPKEGRILSRVENFLPYHALFQTLISGPRLTGTVSRLLGEQAVLFKDKINFKMPGADGFKMHQDIQAGWDRYCAYHITAMVTLDPTTRSNGCLEIASNWPGRELRPIGRMWEPLTDADLTDCEFTPMETEPGDVIFFDSYIPHGSQPNRTAAPRRVLYITWNACSAGNHRERYYADKRKSYPPDIERDPQREYRFRV